MAKRIGHTCSYCGSSDVLLDAWAEWDVEKQDWVLHDTLIEGFCTNCDGDTQLLEVELADGVPMTGP